MNDGQDIENSNHEAKYVILGTDFEWFVPAKEDIPAVVSSLACFASFLVYGASCGSLGAVLPYLADQCDTSTGSMGAAFTTRGAGYTVGTLASAYLISFSDKYIYKDTVNCIALCFSGITFGIIGNSSDYATVLAAFFFQGLGFGAMDTFANCCFPEIWGKRVQPWMQMLHTCFGIGAIVGPAMVGGFGLMAAFNAFFIASFFPLIGLLTYKMYYNIEQRMEHNTIIKQQKQQDQLESVSINSQCVNPIVVQEVEIPTTTITTTTITTDNNNNNNSKNNAVMKEDGSSTASSQTTSFTDISFKPQKQQASPASAASEKRVIKHVEEENHKELPPLNLRISITMFLFMYVGLIVGFSGWIPYYALESDVTSSYATAAYLTSIFYIALTLGRIISIPASMHVTTSFMLRTELTLLMMSTILGMIILDLNFAATASVTSLMALSLCAIYPIMLTIVDEFDYKVDSNDIKIFIVGGTLGEAIIPIFFGLAIDSAGPYTMPILSLTLAIMLCILYGLMHHFAVKMIQAASLRDESIGSLTVSLL